jgi:hypothetical protein
LATATGVKGENREERERVPLPLKLAIAAIEVLLASQ